jgi:hypothetical protein
VAVDSGCNSMMFYRLTSKIGLVMMVLTFVLAALAVNSKRLFGVSFSDTMIELAIGATFLVAVAIGIAWHWRALNSAE